MAYPKTQPHRRNRRKLGRGQFPPSASLGCVVTSTGTTNATLTFSRPVVVRGNLTNTVATRTLSSQTQTSPTVVSQTWSGNVTGLAYSVPAAMPNLSGVQGGVNSGVSGTFP